VSTQHSQLNTDGLPGNSVTTFVSTTSPQSVITDSLSRNFWAYDRWVIALTQGTRTDQYGKTAINCPRHYNPNGALSAVVNVSNPFRPADHNPNTLFFDTSVENGRPLAEWSVMFDKKGANVDVPTIFFQDGQGHVIATYGKVTNPAGQTERLIQITADPVRSFNASRLLNGVKHVIIQCGDDWTTISYRVFRDPNYASILRAYSGVPLIPGQTIDLIQTLDAYNKAQDYAPYQRLMDVIYNSMNPALKTPQPPPPPPTHHESFWDEVIGIAVAVVVMFVVPPDIVAVLPAVTGLLATSVETGVAFAVAGALADAASQGVAIAFDDQHGFSIKEMYENAVAAGVTAGISKALGISELLSDQKYARAFSESVGLGLTVQLFQMSVGLRDKLDIKIIIEQAAATVLDAAANKHLPNALKASKPATHAVDELENTTLGAAFGEQPDLTALAGNELGDIAARGGADVLARRTKLPAPAQTVGKSTSPSQYTSHTHALHTASHFMPSDAAGSNEDDIDDLYEEYKAGLLGDVNEIASANFSAASASLQNSAEAASAVCLQRRATRNASLPGFFQRGVNRFVKANEAQFHSDVAAIESTGRFINSVGEALDDPMRAAMAMYAVSMGGMIGLSNGMNSTAGQWLLHSLNANAAVASSMNPINAMFEAGTGYNSITGQPVSVGHAYENFGTSTLALFSAEAGELALEGARVAGEVLPGVARNVASMFGRGEKTAESALQDLYHTKTSAGATQGILDGVDPGRLLRGAERNRFGAALYLSEIPDTTLAELAYHGNSGYATIRYSFNKTEANILDLTDAKIARQWEYVGGDDYSVPQDIARQAQIAGFNAIRFSSERGIGANLAVLNNFDRLLQPQMVVPVPQELRAAILKPDLMLNIGRMSP